MKDLKKIDIWYTLAIGGVTAGLLLANYYIPKILMSYRRDLTVMHTSLNNVHHNMKVMAEEYFDYDLDEDKAERLMS